ncbi:hypothetical protein [Streptomyces sp. NRRL S-118]|nr:hypothetical protein [Streptomyces sp. NRRL S-118]
MTNPSAASSAERACGGDLRGSRATAPVRVSFLAVLGLRLLDPEGR